MPALDYEINNVFECTIQSKLFNQTCVNTFGFKALTVDEPISLAEALPKLFEDAVGYFNLQGNFRQSLRAIQTGEVQHIKFTCKKVIPDRLPPFEFPVLTNQFGTAVGTCETPNIAVSIQRRGIFATKSNRGRVAVAGCPSDQWASGIFTPAYLANCDQFGADLVGVKAVPGLGTIEMGFVRVDKVGPDLFYGFTGCVVTKTFEQVRTQRSRTIGRGV